MKRVFTLQAIFVGLTLATTGSLALASPYATELVSSSSTLTGSSLYNDPSAVLGAPSANFRNGSATAQIRKTKLVEPAWAVGVTGEKLITTLNAGQEIVVAFDHQVENDPNNPYGIDFLVFGNSFYVGNGSVSDATNMNAYTLAGGIFSESVLVSVSQNGTDWYTFSNGPSGDSAYPTNGYLWDAETATWTDTQSDFTKPVDPSLTVSKGDTAAEIIAAYEGSGGGTGYDLDDLYPLYGVTLDWIQYIKVEGITGYSGGEIDAFADVAASPVPVPGAALLLGSSLLGLLGFRRRAQG